VGVRRQLGEADLDHRQPGARAGRLERELDVGAARIVVGQPVDGQVNPNTVGSSTRSTRMSAVNPSVHVIRAARPGAGRSCLVAEPGAQALGRGERGPHRGRRVSELHGPLDPIQGNP
jgi:hypothetical protein